LTKTEHKSFSSPRSADPPDQETQRAVTRGTGAGDILRVSIGTDRMAGSCLPFGLVRGLEKRPMPYPVQTACETLPLEVAMPRRVTSLRTNCAGPHGKRSAARGKGETSSAAQRVPIDGVNHETHGPFPALARSGVLCGGRSSDSQVRLRLGLLVVIPPQTGECVRQWPC
jgi:hypothetical protein